MRKTRFWDRAYDKAVFKLPLTDAERCDLDQAIYWCVHNGSGPFPQGPKQRLISQLKAKMRGR